MGRKRLDLRFRAAAVLVFLDLIFIILIRNYTNSSLLFEQIWISTAISLAIIQVSNKLKSLGLDVALSMFSLGLMREI